jgi:hypothetical protein
MEFSVDLAAEIAAAFAARNTHSANQFIANLSYELDFFDIYILPVSEKDKADSILSIYFKGTEAFDYSMVHNILLNKVYVDCKTHNFIHEVVLPHIQQQIDTLQLEKATARLQKFSKN